MILLVSEINSLWDVQCGSLTEEIPSFPLIGYGQFHTLEPQVAERIAWDAASRVHWQEAANCTFFSQVLHAAFLTHANDKNIGRYAEGIVCCHQPYTHEFNWFMDHCKNIWFINGPWWNPGRSSTNEPWMYLAPAEFSKFWGRRM